MNKEVLFSSKTDMWATPQDFYDKLNETFKFETDVCATADNAKCDKFYSPEEDGLKQDWEGTCWMNPPYGREISAWIEKACNSSHENGTTVVCLVPARTDTRWWHNYCSRGEIHYLKGRLKFGNSKASAPFPSAVVVFRPSVKDAIPDAI